MKLRFLIDRFARDKRGIGAIEFAIITPVLLMLYIGAVQLTVGLTVAKRASQAAGSIADIVTQQTSVDTSFLSTMPTVAAAIFSPFGVNGMTLKITAISIDGSGNAKVSWSWAQDGTRPYAVNSAVSTVPTNLMMPNSFLIRSEFTVPYKFFSFGPDFLPSTFNQVTLQRTYFFRQRVGTSISCATC